MIKNKTLAIILASLTFIVGSIVITIAAFYIAKIPLSAIWQGNNQYILFMAILVSAILASMVYGRGTKQKADESAEFLNEKLNIQISGKEIGKLLKLLENFPPFVVNMYISKNINAVEEFEIQIKEQITKLNDKDLSKAREIIEMPIPDLQDILNELYSITSMEQLKILSETRAEPLIKLNLEEMKRVLQK